MTDGQVALISLLTSFLLTFLVGQVLVAYWKRRWED